MDTYIFHTFAFFSFFIHLLHSYACFILTFKSDTIMASDWSSLLRTTPYVVIPAWYNTSKFIGIITGDLLISYFAIIGSNHFIIRVVSCVQDQNPLFISFSLIYFVHFITLSQSTYNWTISYFVFRVSYFIFRISYVRIR